MSLTLALVEKRVRNLQSQDTNQKYRTNPTDSQAWYREKRPAEMEHKRNYLQ